MPRAILLLITAAALAVVTLSTAEAAKPALVVESVFLTDTGNCVATVTWSGLKGGKSLDIATNLREVTGGGSVPGATQTYTVRQGAGMLQIDYGPAPQWATDTRLIFEATFVTRDGNVFASAAGTCVP